MSFYSDRVRVNQLITNADVAPGAGIEYSKLNLTNSIVNADINAAAAIAYSKLNLSGSIVNADIAVGAAIAYSKLNLSGSIVNADVAVGAAIAYSKLNLSLSIVNADISTSAAIDQLKLGTGAYVAKTTTYTATTSDNFIEVSTAAGWTLTLYTAVGNAGRQLTIVKTSNDANTLTIDGNGAETIDGLTTFPLINQYEGIRLVSNGANWVIASRFQISGAANKTANYTATIFDEVIRCDTSGGSFSIFLYTAQTNKARRLVIAKTTADNNTVTVDGASSQTIDGQLTQVLARQYECIEIQSLDNSTWTIVGRYFYSPVVSKTTTYTATQLDETIKCDTSGGAWTLTLPAAAGNAGLRYKIVKTTADNNALTIDGNASETINGATTISISSQYEAVEIVCDGSNWFVQNRNFYGPIVSKTTTYTATIFDELIKCDTSGGAWTLTLYAAAGNAGKRLKIIKTSSDFNYFLTIDGNASETINGATTFKLCTQYESVEIECDGSNWFVVNRSIPSVWTAYTPTISTATGTMTNHNDTGFWRRVGDSMEIMGAITFTGAVGTWGSVRVDIPTGSLQIDTAKLATTSITLLGDGYAVDAGATYYRLALSYFNTTTLEIFCFSASGSYVNAATPNQAVPFSFASGDNINWIAKVPILDWSA